MRHHLGTRTAPAPLIGSERLLVCLLIVGVTTLVGTLLLRPHARRAVSPANGSVSSLAALDHDRTQPPDVWVGRTVPVEGQAAIYRIWQPPDSIVTRIALVDPHQAGALPPLVLEWGSADPVLDALRRLPVVGRLAPRPQRLHWGEMAVYRIRLDGFAPEGRGSLQGVLLDADPSGP
jgi:hypothetical protein